MNSFPLSEILGIVILYLIVLNILILVRFKHAIDLLKKERIAKVTLTTAHDEIKNLHFELDATREAHEQTYKERFEEGFKAGELEQKAKVPVFPKQYLTDELMQIHLMKREAV